MWSDVRAALWALSEEIAASSDGPAVDPGRAQGSAFGKPPPANVLALVPHEKGV